MHTKLGQKPKGKRPRWEDIMRRAPNIGRVSNVGRCDIFMKKVQPPPNKQEKLRIKECALLSTGEVPIYATGVAMTRKYCAELILTEGF
jgi:hypothetical protein